MEFNRTVAFDMRNVCELPLNEAVVYRAVFVKVSGVDGRKGNRAETLLEPAK